MIFKVAENSEGQDAVSRKGAGASINVARRRPQESQERPATSSRLRPVEDVRSFSSGLGHITKGRYDRCDSQPNIFGSLKINNFGDWKIFLRSERGQITKGRYDRWPIVLLHHGVSGVLLHSAVI